MRMGQTWGCKLVSCVSYGLCELCLLVTSSVTELQQLQQAAKHYLPAIYLCHPARGIGHEAGAVLVSRLGLVQRVPLSTRSPGLV